MHIPFWHNDDILVSELQIEVEDTFIASILANLPFSIGIVKMIVAHREDDRSSWLTPRLDLS